MHPFGAADQKTDFTPERIAIEKLDGRLVAERCNLRGSFAGHQLMTPWDPLQRGYFNGYALWTYLTTPFLMALPGFSVQEIDPVEDNGETWAGLQVRFPAGIASHSPDAGFLLRRGPPHTPPRLSRRCGRRICDHPIRLRHRQLRRDSSARLSEARIAAIPTERSCRMN